MAIGTRFPTPVYTAFQNRGGKIVKSQGVYKLGHAFGYRAYRAVVEFQGYNKEDDPRGVHESGRFTLDGVELHFRLFYFNDRSMTERYDVADEAYRVVVIALPEELRD